MWQKKVDQTNQIDNRTDKRKLGDIGENAVCEYLKSKGFSIVETNYLRKWGELDVVAKKSKKIHFLEVKSISREISMEYDVDISHETKNGVSREMNDEYRAEDNLHPDKLKRLSRAIQTYVLDRHVSEETEWQFDVATVLVDQKKKICKVSILEDIII
jgi:putative endonuclease